MAKPELGTKRICPETGRKFYDLNKDPIVSPYTGHSYPRSYFDAGKDTSIDDEEEEVEERELDSEDEDAEVVSLEDADEEAKGSDSDVPDIEDEEDVEISDDDDDTFLEDDDEEEDDDVKGMIGGRDEDED